jgi:hypothetical protein
MKVKLIQDLMERLREPSQKTQLMEASFDRAVKLYRRGLEISPRLNLCREWKFSRSLFILRGLELYIRNETSLNKYQEDSYARLGNLIPRLEAIVKILFRLYPENESLVRMLPKYQYISDNPPRHFPPAKYEVFLCLHAARFLPRALEAHDKAWQRDIIDPEITVDRVNEMETFVLQAEDILSNHQIPVNSPILFSALSS